MHRRRAPGRRASAFSATDRTTHEPWASDQYVTFARTAGGSPDQTHQGVARLDGARLRTWLCPATGPVHFTRGNPRQPDPRPFGTP